MCRSQCTTTPEVGQTWCLVKGVEKFKTRGEKGQAQAGYDEAKASCVRSRRQGKEAKIARSDLHQVSLTASCPPFLSTHQGCIQCRVSFSVHSTSYANDAFDFTAGFIFRTTLAVSIATVYLQISIPTQTYFTLEN